MDLYRLETGFFPGQCGAIHLSLFLPKAGLPSRWVIHFPAFADEMNKSRAVVARAARALAEAGAAVVVPDLYGTGDSEGDFVNAAWDIWLADQLKLANWAREQGATHLTFWGLRAGCLLAADAAATIGTPPEQLLYWQPVHSGKQLMTQFLRLRMAATLTQESESAEPGSLEESRVTAASLRDILLQEGSLRVAGYQLGAGLLQAFEARQLSAVPVPQGTSINVQEVAGAVGTPANRVTQSQLQRWQQNGVPCHFSQVQGDGFWATQELGDAPALTAGIVAAIEGISPLSDTIPFVPTGLLSSTPGRVTSLVFPCDNDRLVGVLHLPAAEVPETAVVIVVGGPQYRAGSHRQFVLLARVLAEAGFATLRFDYRGMGDSEGPLLGFENLEADVGSAIDALQAAAPSVKRVVLWGLCDAATASVCYAPADQRVQGLVLANPWVYSEQGAAKAYLKHYYLQRLLSRSFWSKVWTGGFRPGQSLASMARFFKSAAGKSTAKKGTAKKSAATVTTTNDKPAAVRATPIPGNLVESVANSLTRFDAPILLLISGKDLTAAEFMDAGRSHAGLRKALESPRVHRVDLPGVDHTFSRPEWRAEVEACTIDFLRHLDNG